MNRPYRTTQLEGVTDLTLMACIKPGLVEGNYETESYTERLRRTLAVLDAVRKKSRESTPFPSPFPDPVGRFRGIHFFRYAILPADQAPHAVGGPDRLILNVTFDGGWEPYMRIIWGPVGKLLDLIFCHCEGYPLSHECRFDDYMRWVRKFEIPSDFFYSDSAASVGDRRYHAALEALVARAGHEPDFGLEAARLAVPATTPDTVPGPMAAMTGLRVLGAFDSLRPLFPVRHGDDGVLLRFAQDLLGELHGWVAEGRFDANGEFAHLRPPFARQIDWLMTPRVPREGQDRLRFKRADVQAGIADPLPADAPFGMIGLFAVSDRALALPWLRTAPVTPGDAPALPASPDDYFCNLALTFTGLRRLQVHERRLARLPQEFVDGMEARAGVLGDQRANHPEQWARPRLGGDGPLLDLRSVHLLVQLRTAARAGEAAADVHPRLKERLRGLEQHGLSLLAEQPMRSMGQPGRPPRGHLGFADGISQPRLAPHATPPAYWSDEVKPGELFCGYLNARDRLPSEPVDGDGGDLLLDNGSFFVVRKLRQHLERMQAQLEQQARAALPPGANEATVAALSEAYQVRMMGRERSGAPLATSHGAGDNDFDYRADPGGEQCPFASHVRRVNPRAADAALPLPRIARRGMSYGDAIADGEVPRPEDDRGLVFIACCASIAEQFEVLQRWISGGNASGLSTAQSDPFLGLPEQGRARIFRCVIEGKAHAVDLGRLPWVTLQWGLYAFAPSLSALKSFDRIVGGIRPDEPAPPAPAPLLGAEGERWRARLEDRNQRKEAWAAVHATKDAQGKKSGVADGAGYGVLVAGNAALRDILRDDGQKFSVCGYGDRMRQSIGLGYLGQDDAGAHAGHREHAPAVNDAIEKFRDLRGACADAAGMARGVLARLQAGPPPAHIDLRQLAGGVIAGLCRAWFGLPDAAGRFMVPGAESAGPGQPAQCPGSFLPISRYIFSTPHPPPAGKVESDGQAQGRLVRERVSSWLGETPPDRRGPLAQAVLGALGRTDDRDLETRTLAGIMLGFPPTVMGNLIGVLMKWAASGLLWDLQIELRRAKGDDFDAAELVLRTRILETMALAPVPFAIWRTAGAQAPADLHGVKLRSDEGAPRTIVLGLGASAAVDKDPMLMFGGARSGAGATVHACPGYHLALGVMIGTIATLLRAGSLRPGDNPLALKLGP